ncbi:type II toxin-antitoxin system VapC family toxin [candidate division KSB1 bacterium]|nr:type II toxin-antitoxin system VapC family toxin [candidate division KSB1 bacterium]
MIVVDTDIIAYLFIEGEHTEFAEKVLQKDGEWAAPLLWRSEFCNVLSFYIRQKHLILDRAAKLMNEALYLMADNEYDVSSLDVLRLAELSGCSTYDCEFVSLAKDLGTYLITSDKKILKAFPDHTISLDIFV